MKHILTYLSSTKFTTLENVKSIVKKVSDVIKKNPTAPP